MCPAGFPVRWERWCRWSSGRATRRRAALDYAARDIGSAARGEEPPCTSRQRRWVVAEKSVHLETKDFFFKKEIKLEYKTKNPDIHLLGNKLSTSCLSKYRKEKAARVQGPNRRGRKTREIALWNSNQKTRRVVFSNKLANCDEMAVLKGVTSSSFFHHRGYSSLACATLESFYCFCFYYLKCWLTKGKKISCSFITFLDNVIQEKKKKQTYVFVFFLCCENCCL